MFILRHFKALKFKIFFNHGEDNLRKIEVEFVRSKPFQSIKSQNVLQPWRRYFEKIEVEFVRSKPFQVIEIQNFLQPL